MNNISKLVSLAALWASASVVMASDLVVIGHQSAAALTKDQVADIFLGKNQALTPVDLPEAASSRTVFYKKATGRDQAQVRAVWSRLVFSGKGQLPKELPDSAAVKKAVSADPKTVGYVEKSAVDGSVKVLAAVE